MKKEIKISCKNSIKRIEQPNSFDGLKSYILAAFNDRKSNLSQIFYCDNEGDSINISNEEDYIGAMLYMNKNNIEVLRVFVDDKEKIEHKIENSNINVNLNINKPSKEEDNDFLLFIKDFLKFAHENYERVDNENREKRKLTNSIKKKKILEKGYKFKDKSEFLFEWLKAARVNLKIDRLGEQNGHFIFSMEGINKLRIRYVYKNQINMRASKSKVVKIDPESYDEKWELEYAIGKMQNLLSYLCINFMNLHGDQTYNLSQY